MLISHNLHKILAEKDKEVIKKIRDTKFKIPIQNSYYIN